MKRLMTLWIFLILVAGAQAQTVDRSDYLSVTHNTTLGSKTFGEVLRITGVRIDINSSDADVNKRFFVWDSDGDVWRGQYGILDYPRKAETAAITGFWTFGSGARYTDSTAALSGAASGVDNVAIGIRSGTPRIKLEDSAGSNQWEIDNSSSVLRFMRTNGSGVADSTPLSLSGAVIFAPLGEQIIPAQSYKYDLGTFAAMFRSAAISTLFIQNLTTVEESNFAQGMSIWGRGSELKRPLLANVTTIFVKHKAFKYQDILRMNSRTSGGLPQMEALRVEIASPYDCTGAVTPLPATCGGIDDDSYAYTVCRSGQLNNWTTCSTSALVWEAGTAVVSTGAASDSVPTGNALVSAHNSGKNGFGSIVLADRPIWYWEYNDASTAVPNRTAISGSNLAIQAGATHSGGSMGASTHYSGTPNGAMYANINTNTVVTAASNLTFPIGTAGLTCNMSVEIVFLLKKHSSDAYWPILKYGGTASNINLGLLYTGAGSSGTVTLRGSVGGITHVALANPIAISPGYQHIVATYSNLNGGRIYLNGALQPASFLAPTGCTVDTGTIFINQLRGDLGTFGDILDEASVYNYELGPDQVAAHFQAITVNAYSIQVGPNFETTVRTGGNFEDQDTTSIMGQLQGRFDYTTPEVGFAAGRKSGSWISVDPTNGLRGFRNGTEKWFQLSTSGFQLGLNDTGRGNVFIDTSGNMFFRSGSTDRITLNASTGNIGLSGDLTVGAAGAVHNSTATSISSGDGFWIDSASGGRVRVGSISSTNYMQFDGSTFLIKAGNGATTINSAGVTVKTNTSVSYLTTAGYNFELQAALSGSRQSIWGYSSITGSGSDTAILFWDNTIPTFGGAVTQITAIGQSSDKAQLILDTSSSIPISSLSACEGGTPCSSFVARASGVFMTPAVTDTGSVGTSSKRVGDIFWDEDTNATTSSLDPVVSSLGELKRKTNGYSGTCADKPVVERGIVVGCVP